MTATAAPTVNNQELVSFGLFDSASVNSSADFAPSKSEEIKLNAGNDDFANDFICHLIFYAFFCVSLIFYIFIDLGLGSFLRNKFSQLIDLRKKTVLEKMPAFA